MVYMLYDNADVYDLDFHTLVKKTTYPYGHIDKYFL